MAERNYRIVTVQGGEYSIYASDVRLNDGMIFFYLHGHLVGLFPTHCTMIVDTLVASS
jgi:hypothetical protein